MVGQCEITRYGNAGAVGQKMSDLFINMKHADMFGVNDYVPHYMNAQHCHLFILLPP